MQLNIPCNRFAFRILREVIDKETPKNTVLAPISLWLALSAMANGADQKTLEEMREVLGWQDSRLKDMNIAIEELLQKLSVNIKHIEIPEKPPKPLPTNGVYDASSIQSLTGRRPRDAKEPRVMLANGIWIDENVELADDFRQILQTFFDAEVENIDFADDSAVDCINQWVRDKTLGLIPYIISSLSPLATLILVNAIYFQASWLYKFEEDNTKPHDFHLIAGETQQINMMFKLWIWDYTETETYQAIRLAYRKPYKSETPTEFSMCMFLPREDINFAEFQADFNEEFWQKARSELKQMQGYLGLPKFEIDYSVNMVNILQKLGMRDAFDMEKADFSRTIEQALPFFIEQVLHKTYVGVDEEGTTAASASALFSYVTGGSPVFNRQFEMVMDRPFIFTIQDESTETLLFMGSVVNPLA